jgi:hypothetical protein
MTKPRKDRMPGAPETTGDPAHAPGKRHIGPAPTGAGAPSSGPAKRGHDQPWVPTSGLVGRTRRSARRG